MTESTTKSAKRFSVMRAAACLKIFVKSSEFGTLTMATLSSTCYSSRPNRFAISINRSGLNVFSVSMYIAMPSPPPLLTGI